MSLNSRWSKPVQGLKHLGVALCGDSVMVDGDKVGDRVKVSVRNVSEEGQTVKVNEVLMR